jgi:hypothetical protein
MMAVNPGGLSVDRSTFRPTLHGGHFVAPLAHERYAVVSAPAALHHGLVVQSLEAL